MMPFEKWTAEDDERQRCHEIEQVESYCTGLIVSAYELGETEEIPKAVQGTPVEPLIFRLRVLTRELLDEISAISEHHPRHREWER
jgi:hypothetical protein